METIQITNLSLSEFQKMIDTAVESAVTIALAKFATKQDPYEELTLEAVAEMWSCSKRTVIRRINYHQIPTIRLGKKTTVKRKHLEALKKPLPKSN